MHSGMYADGQMKRSLPFRPDSELFQGFRAIWRTELDEELTYQKAEELGLGVLVVVALATRWKRSASS